MRKRRMHSDDKEKMFASFKGMWPEFSIKVLALFEAGQEISTKELSEKSKKVNNGYPFNKNAINKVLTSELKDKVIHCGKNKWKLRG